MRTRELSRLSESVSDSLIQLLYNVIFVAVLILLLPRYLLRMWRRGGYRDGFMQRFGVYDPAVINRCKAQPPIWIHAVSVGEMHVALQFARQLRKKLPEMCFVFSTTTSTGHAVAQKTMDQSDVLVYYPTDFPFAVKRALNNLRPRALILVEGEIWPNMIRAARDAGIPVIVCNGRLSKSSYRGYRKLRGLLRPVFRRIDLLLVQSRREKEWYTELGCDPSRIEVPGSAKYDVVEIEAQPEVQAHVKCLLERSGIDAGCRLLVGGSTWAGEEAALIDVFKKLRTDFNDMRLVLVPRHMERRNEIEALLKAAGLNYVMRSRLDEDSGNGSAGVKAEVLVVDSTGELNGFYAAAAVVFVGKSLTNRGGQNFLEPAALGKAVLVGPHLENFPVLAEQFMEAGAFVQVHSVEELTQATRKLLSDDTERARLGSAARQTVLSNRGVIERSVNRMLPLLLQQQHQA